jgi:DNA polymerase-3 subunit alpha/error-prone DNA polymerase
MVLYDDVLKKTNVIKAVDIRRFVGRRIQMAGFLVTGKRVRTKHGDPMEFVTFEDETGLVETVFFPEVYHRFCSKLYHKGLFILNGRVEEDFGACTLTVFHLDVIRPPVKDPA